MPDLDRLGNGRLAIVRFPEAAEAHSSLVPNPSCPKHVWKKATACKALPRDPFFAGFGWAT